MGQERQWGLNAIVVSYILSSIYSIVLIIALLMNYNSVHRYIALYCSVILGQDDNRDRLK